MCSFLLCLHSPGIVSGGAFGPSFGGSFTMVCVFVPVMLFCREVMGTICILPATENPVHLACHCFVVCLINRRMRGIPLVL